MWQAVFSEPPSNFTEINSINEIPKLAKNKEKKLLKSDGILISI